MAVALSRLRRWLVAALVAGLIAGWCVQVGTATASFFSKRWIIDEGSRSYEWGFREGTNVSDASNPFEVVSSDDWEDLADRLYDQRVDELRACDLPGHTGPPAGPDDYEDYAAGQVAGMQEKSLTGRSLLLIGPTQGNWDCD